MALNAPRSRTIVLTDAGTAAFTVALAEYDGTVSNATPTPAPVFTTPSSIATDGTPQVGEQLTGIDGVATNAASYARRWLLGSTVLTSSATYTPSAVGTYRYETIATGPGGEMTSGSNITVAAASPVLNALTISPSTATVGTSATIAINGATAGSVITGTVPAGMTLNSAARTITGTPTTAGSPSIVLTETLAGATGSPRQSTVSVTIAAAPVTPVLGALTVSPSAATVGTAYSGTINGLTSGSSIALSGAGAAGLSIAGGVITGTPTTAGAVNIVETLAGATGSPRTSSGVVTVAAAAVVLAPLTLSPNTATVGTAYTGTIAGKTSGSTLALSGAGAAGLSISGTTVSGTPTTAGSVNIIETLAGATSSPRTSSGVMTVAAAAAAQALRLVSAGGKIPDAVVNSTTAAVTWQSRVIFGIGSGDVSELQLSFDNWQFAGREIGNGTDTITYSKVALEINGVVVPVTFNGSRSVTLAPGDSMVLSDKILPSAFGLSVFARDLTTYVRCSGSAATVGGNIPCGMFASVTGTRMERGGGSVVITDAQVDAIGAMTSQGGTVIAQANTATCLVGRYVTGDPVSTIGVGDSIMVGLADLASATPYGKNWIARAAQDGSGKNLLSFMQAAHSGDNNWLVTAAASARTRKYMAICNTMIEEFGTNDFGSAGAGDINTIYSNAVKLWDLAKGEGVKNIIRTLLLPRVDTTDNGATVANQTPRPGWGVGEGRDQLNQKFRDAATAGTVKVALDLLSVVQAGSDTTRWAATYSQDGIHPYQAPANAPMGVFTRTALLAL